MSSLWGFKLPWAYKTQPIFLRAAHSPWRALNQNALGYIRAAILAYLIVTGGMLLDYKIKHREDEHTNWRIPFQFSTVVWVLLTLYHLMVTVGWKTLQLLGNSSVNYSKVMDSHAHALA